MSEDKTGCVAFCVRMVRIVLRLAITRILLEGIRNV